MPKQPDYHRGYAAGIHMLLYGPVRARDAEGHPEGKALEILIQVLEQADRDAAFSRPLLNKKDTEKIYTAKEWLDKHSSVSVTLFKLAKGGRMNVHKLSAGFLQIIGTTIFYYHGRCA